jgi:hypothetical protein
MEQRESESARRWIFNLGTIICSGKAFYCPVLSSKSNSGSKHRRLQKGDVKCKKLDFACAKEAAAKGREERVSES